MKRHPSREDKEKAKKKLILCKIDDPIHPLQFWGNSKKRQNDPLSPEKNLWSAVLEDAINCVRGKVSGATSRASKEEEIQYAKEWFLSDSTDTGSFLWICSLLNMPSQRILKKVGDLYKSRRLAA